MEGFFVFLFLCLLNCFLFLECFFPGLLDGFGFHRHHRPFGVCVFFGFSMVHGFSVFLVTLDCFYLFIYHFWPYQNQAFRFFSPMRSEGFSFNLGV